MGLQYLCFDDYKMIQIFVVNRMDISGTISRSLCALKYWPELKSQIKLYFLDLKAFGRSINILTYSNTQK